MDDYVPKMTPKNTAAANLRAKVEAVENERLQFGAERDALEELAAVDEKLAADPGFRQELEQARRNVQRADARIKTHLAALERVGGEA